MSDIYHERLARLSDPTVLPLLRRLQRGVEKESLRVDPDGGLAQTPHPVALGSTLTHPCITTDYSEALLEFITPVARSIDETLAQLREIHQFVDRELQSELLWNASMPCRLGSDAEIPVARYGSSNSGRMKTVYRLGLGHRYGRHMQTIAGIHYNFSIDDGLWPLLLEGPVTQAAVTEAYFGLIRNFRRWSWLLIYLFGASPALDRSFLPDTPHTLETLSDDTLFSPYATSLRMGDLGYQSSAQEHLDVCYNQLASYVATLKQGILEPHPDYERIGVCVDGEYRQLSAGLLQIENEFYSTIRPKRVAARGETALSALAHRGVQYIEVRCLDINPYLPVGIDAETMRFLDAFLLYCLTAPSPLCDAAGQAELKRNTRLVVNEGRRPGLALRRDGVPIGLQAWGGELLDAIAPMAALLDAAHGSDDYRRSLDAQRARVADAALTPSAQLLRDLAGHGNSHVALTLAQSRGHLEQLRDEPLAAARLAELREASSASLARQATLEAEDQLPFADYLSRYFEQYRAL